MTRIRWLTRDEFHAERDAFKLTEYLAFVKRAIDADTPVGAWGMEEDGTVWIESTPENFKQCAKYEVHLLPKVRT